MRFKSSCEAIKVLENGICRELVKQNKARFLSKIPVGIQKGNPDNGSYYTKTYLIFVGSDSVIAEVLGIGGNVRVDFRYDYRDGGDKGEVAISRTGLSLLINSVTVSNLLKKLDFVSPKGKITDKELKQLAEYAISESDSSKKLHNISVDVIKNGK